MKKIVIAFILLFVAGTAKADVFVFFSPSKDCENNIIRELANASKKVDAAVYAINNTNIVNELKKAHDRGVKIRILTDRLQASNRASKVRELKKYGINVRVHSKYKIEHNKFAVFDEKTAVSGSYNWTNPASEKNSENCSFYTADEDVVEIYQKRFRQLWKANTKKKSDEWFEKKRANS